MKISEKQQLSFWLGMCIIAGMKVDLDGPIFIYTFLETGGFMHRSNGTKYVDIATRIRLKSEPGVPPEATGIQGDVFPEPVVLSGEDDVPATGC